MSDKPTLNMIGGGFQHAYSSCGWERPTKIVWDKDKHEGAISVHIDDAVFGIKPDASKINIAWLCESPYFMSGPLQAIETAAGEKYLRENFRYTFCSYLDYIKKYPFLTYVPPHARAWVDDKKIFPKTKLISMIASNKNEAPGHQLRHMVAKNYGDSIDLYGMGYKPIKSKNEGLNDYMFSFAIENIKNNGYFTEKLLDCFATGTIPIYWGDPSIGNNFLTDGMIMLNDDFDGSYLTKEFYESKRCFIEENYSRAINFPIPEDYIYDTYLKHL